MLLELTQGRIVEVRIGADAADGLRAVSLKMESQAPSVETLKTIAPWIPTILGTQGPDDQTSVRLTREWSDSDWHFSGDGMGVPVKDCKVKGVVIKTVGINAAVCWKLTAVVDAETCDALASMVEQDLGLRTEDAGERFAREHAA